MSSVKLGIEAIKAIASAATPVLGKAATAFGGEPIKAVERMAAQQAALFFASSVFSAAQATTGTGPRTSASTQPFQHAEARNSALVSVLGRTPDIGRITTGATSAQSFSGTAGQAIAGQLTNIVIDNVAAHLQSRLGSTAMSHGALVLASPQATGMSEIFHQANAKLQDGLHGSEDQAGPKHPIFHGPGRKYESNGSGPGRQDASPQWSAKPGSENHRNDGAPPRPTTPPAASIPNHGQPFDSYTSANLTPENVTDWSNDLQQKAMQDQLDRYERNVEFRRMVDAMSDAFAMTKDMQQRLSQVTAY